ncbi:MULTISPECIES: hypothetical protein [unclassified Sporosarcina]|uniref:hypothetical protein n=1 Tax=unclassified Sporosarcina TaxID=2647733 RepID=UPI000C165C1C|nr:MULTISPECIES: hypothetical protein [unclassified Sporosarcina]PID14826.1 hypothetical protein CSV63_10265 [Sporosarcina sp. P34]PID24830.1 hypothetical protein CSV60_07940 [Sporosarcina sp. P7]
MIKTFYVIFHDEKRLKVSDIISFEQPQVDEIIHIASQYTLRQLRREEKKGKDLSYLTPNQIAMVVSEKDQIVHDKSADELRLQGIVQAAEHSLVQMFERQGSDELPYVIDLINRVIDTDTVVKAQFKGHPTLTYTMMMASDPEHFKIPVSFVWESSGTRFIKIVTLMFRNAPPKKLTSKIVQDQDMEDRMLEFKRKLLDESRK